MYRIVLYTSHTVSLYHYIKPCSNTPKRIQDMSEESVAASGNKAYGPDRPVRGVGGLDEMNQNHTTKPRKKQKVKEETGKQGSG